MFIHYYCSLVFYQLFSLVILIILLGLILLVIKLLVIKLLDFILLVIKLIPLGLFLVYLFLHRFNRNAVIHLTYVSYTGFVKKK